MILRWILGGVFIYASIHKILWPADFAKIIYGYKLFPAVSINLLAVILPCLELTIGLALMLGIYPRTAGLLMNFILLFFCLAITINLIRGHEFDCGCFAVSRSGHASSPVALLLRNVLLFAGGLYILFYSRPRRFCLRQSGGILQNLP